MSRQPAGLVRNVRKLLVQVGEVLFGFFNIDPGSYRYYAAGVGSGDLLILLVATRLHRIHFGVDTVSCRRLLVGGRW